MDPTASTTTARPAGAAAPGEAEAFAEATRLYAVGDAHGALALVRPLVDAHPESLSARLLVARCAARVGAPAVALATAEEAVACDPSSWEAQVLVAQAAVGIDLDRALEAADRALVLAPEQPAAVEARAQVVATRAAGEAPARSGGLGGLTAALGPTRRPPAPEPAPVPPVLDPPPADPPPIRLPMALAGVAPEGTPEVEPPPAVDTDTDTDTDTGSDTGKGWDSPGRTALVALGSITWLYMGFRYGVQVIGGPAGLALFVAVVAFVALFWRTRLRVSARGPSRHRP